MKKSALPDGEYDLVWKVIPIKFNTKKGPQFFALSEASEEVAAQHRNLLVSQMTIQSNKATKFGRIADGEPLLVSLCILRVTEEVYNLLKDDPTVEFKGEKVSLTEVRSWPSKVVKDMYEKVRDMSDLKEESEEFVTLKEAFKEHPPASGITTLEEFNEWVTSLPDEDEFYDYRPLKLWIDNDSEAKAKND